MLERDREHKSAVENQQSGSLNGFFHQVRRRAPMWPRSQAPKRGPEGSLSSIGGQRLNTVAQSSSHQTPQGTAGVIAAGREPSREERNETENQAKAKS